MTFSELKGHLSIASLLKSKFSHSCAAVNKISTDSASRCPSALAEPVVSLLVVPTSDDR